jgi:hypothetical protein
MPKSLKKPATSDFPLPIPPVKPMLNGLFINSINLSYIKYDAIKDLQFP